jgi:hypothetical protein
VKKRQNRRKSLRRLKPTVGCNANKRRRRRRIRNVNEPHCTQNCVNSKDPCVQVCRLEILRKLEVANRSKVHRQQVATLSKVK